MIMSRDAYTSNYEAKSVSVPSDRAITTNRELIFSE